MRKLIPAAATVAAIAAGGVAYTLVQSVGQLGSARVGPSASDPLHGAHREPRTAEPHARAGAVAEPPGRVGDTPRAVRHADGTEPSDIEQLLTTEGLDADRLGRLFEDDPALGAAFEELLADPDPAVRAETVAYIREILAE